MKSKSSVFWGFAIIIVGVLFLGNNIEVWDVDVFFDGWWTLFIIVPSIISLVCDKTFVSSLFGIIIGVLLLLAAQDIIDWSMVVKVFIPVLIILIGISFVCKPRIKNVKKSKEGLPEYIGVFSGNEDKISETFSGSTCIAVFGGVSLDLKNAIIEDNSVIDCVSVFGGIDIVVPDDIEIKITGVPIFGGAENKANRIQNDNKKKLYINYVCVFGGIEIK